MKILFSGDVSISRRYTELSDRGVNLFGNISEKLSTYDFSVMNLETAIATEKSNSDFLPKIGPVLSSPTSSIDSIKNFDLIGLANNHIADLGENALTNTIKIIENNGLNSFGAINRLGMGRRYHIQEVNNVKLAFISVGDCEFSDFKINGYGGLGFDVIDVSSLIIELKKVCDFVALYVHCGVEYYELPTPDLKRKLHYFADLGASAIICHHSHTVGPVEVYNGVPIFYSLGNTLFDHERPPEGWFQGLLVVLEITDSGKYLTHELLPISNSVDDEGVFFLEGDEKRQVLEYVASLSNIVVDDLELNKKWNAYVSENGRDRLLRLVLPRPFRGISKVSKVIEKIFFSSEYGNLSKRNILECDAHLEVVKQYLLNKSERG